MVNPEDFHYLLIPWFCTVLLVNLILCKYYINNHVIDCLFTQETFPFDPNNYI